MSEYVDTIIIGGGQAGLAAGYHVARKGRSLLILDASERVGDGWRKRWDSLRLFTPAKFNHLTGLKFPAEPNTFPTKDEMADYLEQYAAHFELPVRTGMAVTSLTKANGRFVVTARGHRFEADNVIVATGAHQIPKCPEFAPDLDPEIVQLHSKQYKGPSQLQDGPVLVVGLGNSGAEIAFELIKTHETIVAGSPSAQIPFKHGPRAAKYALPIVRFVGTHVLTMRNPIGRKAGPQFVKHAAPLIRVKTKDLEEAGVVRVDRIAGVKDGRPVLEDGRVLDVANVIWTTGFRQNYEWIDLPAFDEEGMPKHRRGIVESVPGLYFMGLIFQFAAVSDVIPGVSRDAAYIAKHIATHRSESAAVTQAVSA